MTWRDTLRRAASLVPNPREYADVERLLSDVLSGSATVAEIAALLGVPGHQRDGFLESLNAAMFSRRPEGPELNAARAVLYRLPYLLDRVLTFPDLSTWDSRDHSSISETLTAIEAHERTLSNGEPVSYGNMSCPRCGWNDVSTRHTDEFERRLIEAKCNACGMYGSWFDGDEEAHAWERKT